MPVLVSRRSSPGARHRRPRSTPPRPATGLFATMVGADRGTGWASFQRDGEEARTGTLLAEHVIGIEQHTAIERETTAADAPGQIVTQSDELLDALVQIGAPE